MLPAASAVGSIVVCANGSVTFFEIAMRTRKFLAIALFGVAIAWIGASFVGDFSDSSGDASNASAASQSAWRDSPIQRSAERYLSSYIVDKDRQIPFKDTGLNASPADPDQRQKGYVATSLVNRGTAEYFRFLQTQFHTGATLAENTAAIRQHLLSTMPPDEADKLFALYQKFVDFEFSLGEKTKGWAMPTSADEALALIGKMQQLQRQEFGEENADLLFGGELKSTEYTARRAGILNDRVASGAEKEAMLQKLATDMFGPESDQLDNKKNPYNLFEEKLLVYKYDLEKMDPIERDKTITALREKYLPPSANNPYPNP